MTNPLCAAIDGVRQSRAEQRREKLIRVARELFADNGFHSTGIAQIAKHSGVLVGQIYRDFSSKEDIVAAIVERDLTEFLADSALCCAIGRRDAGDVRRWIRDFVGGAELTEADRQSERIIVEIMAESSRNARIATILQSCRGRIRTNLMDALAVLVPDPAKADQRIRLVDTILTLSIGLFHHRIAYPDTDDPELIAAIHAMIDREIDRLIAG